MAGMELDAQPGRSPRLSPRDSIVQRLSAKGVPREVLEQFEMGLRLFINDNPAMVPELVSAILPTEGDVSELQKLSKMLSGGPSNESNITDFFTDESNVTDLYGESMLWLGWLMFGDEPQSYLEKLAKKAGGQRAVCGAVWGHNDLAYRCRTCENDPTCAICVPCFLNGNHKDHDYSIIYTGGGCCDCGDETAWKSEGFCSEHRGIRQFQPLPEELANSIRPVLDSLFCLWKSKLTLSEKSRRPNEYNKYDISSAMVDMLSSAVVKMLLHFCECSESLLSFTSIRMFQCTGLLDVLVRAERLLHKSVVKRLHELLLKLLGEPIFKYEFAKVFMKYYPVAVNEIIIGGTDTSNDTMPEKYPLLSTFSVQIFTVPTLMARLVQEVNLLGILLECLRDLLFFCVGDDGNVQANKWVMDLMIRLVEDIRFVLSHEEVLVHVTYEQPDISRAWLKLLTLAQGMNPHKRATTTSTDDEYENISTAFLLGHLIGNVSNLFVQGAFSASKAKQGKDTSLNCFGSQGLDDNEGYRHSKVGRTSRESSVFRTNRSGQLDCSSKYSYAKMDGIGHLYIPSPAMQLISECLKSIDGWLCLARNISHNNDDSSCSCFNSLRKKVFRLKKGANNYKVCRTSVTRQGVHVHQQLSLAHSERFDSMDTDMSADDTSSSRLSDSVTEGDAIPDAEAFGMLNVIDWPDIVYDVSSQGISFHIPLHCLLSLILRKAMEDSYGETKKPVKTSSGFLLPSSVCSRDFFGQFLGGSQPCGFSAFLMEHPLRLRVFCAQVRAGMWRRSADTAIWLSEFYRAGQWINQGLESDLFLLQCCAALAPPELFVRRIQERFGLSNYTSLNISEYNEYEPVLVNEMLTLILQIVKERCFSGLSTVDHLKREVIYKLSVGDATHSQVQKALPRDLSKSDQVQNILDTLATYSNPSGMKQGKYSLRRAYWNELDLYHPRWNYRDLQIAEERYFRFCKVSARNVQLPRWTNTYPPLATISGIATSKAVLEIVRAVFFYAAFTDVSLMSRAPDGVLITALHLLSLALDICCSLSNASTSNFLSDDGLFMEVSHNQEDLPPLLAHATDVLDLTSLPELELGKNQNMLSLLVLLMRKYKDEGDRDYSEMRHCNISSLIETLLKKFAELSNDCLIFLQKLAPKVVCQILKQSAQVPPESSTSSSDVVERRAKARERQAAIMEKMRAEQSRFIANLKSHNEGDSSKEEKLNLEDIADVESEIVCSLCRDPHSQSSLCFLILLQRSRLTTFIEKGPPSWEDVCWENKIQSGDREHSNDSLSGSDSNSMVQLNENYAVQSPFDLEPVEVVTLLGSLEEQVPDMRKIHTHNMFPGTGREDSIPLEKLEDDIYLSAVRNILNSKSNPGDLVREQTYLNKDTAVNSKKDRMSEFFVLGECVVRLLRESKQNHSSIYGLQRIANLSSRSIAPSVPINGFGPYDCDGIHISSCGHAVHHECHDRYLSSLKQRYNRRLGFEGIHVVNPDMGELLCPVCRSFANSILPASTGISKIFSTRRTSIFSNSTSNDFPSVSLDNNCSDLHILLALSLLQNAAKMVGESRVLKVLSGTQIQPINSALEPALKKLFMLYYPLGYDSLSEAGRHSHLLILWDTLRYSITSTEIAARAKLNAYSIPSCLESLSEELHSSSRYVMSILLHIAQSIRSYNSFDVLLRFSSLQLLAGSICSGLSGDNYLSNGDRSKDKPSLFECSHNGDTFPDVQFWKRAADPILAHDPFSSLMWVLFCLPMPFIRSREYFIALVHLFYVICVVQATIACYGKQGFDISSFGGHFGNICKMVTESQSVKQFFVSNYVDELCDPKNMIRRLTFPYLRRCALLWNLLDSSTLAPSFDSHTRERSYLCLKDADLDIDDQLKVELSRIGELEDMFKICSLESVLKDEVVHALALKWCEHFQKEFRVRKYRDLLAVTPAVPFKLMELPFIYQDLLQRYIKVPCSSCKSVPEEPALCLLCGTLCSLSKKSCCCRLGKCSNHAMICGAGIGVFLLVRSTIIFLQRSTRQAFWPSPYLDAFGEEDHDMSRGKPLYLSKERYAALTYMVASHGLDRSSEVLRQTSINLNGLE
ncbi:E3 ubiquitin-protein ligase PRT6 [Curcuma longa]|uniref:E3 ubiquitin-protein ligase PRT6 n=1 Tax=Curcuma longa TaxID=136217 RepID=UPI003D9EE20E